MPQGSDRSPHDFHEPPPGHADMIRGLREGCCPRAENHHDSIIRGLLTNMGRGRKITSPNWLPDISLAVGRTGAARTATGLLVHRQPQAIGQLKGLQLAMVAHGTKREASDVQWRRSSGTKAVSSPTHDPKEDATMKRFVARHAALVTSVLSGFERLVFRGSLRALRHCGIYGR